MEPSPLTLQARPDVFQQKVVSLYQQLFKDEDEVETTEGFWKELFLLKPDKPALLQVIDSLSPEDLLQCQVCHLEQTCTAFLAAVLSKKYTNPSSDIINILAGFDQVDASFSDFVAALDQTIKMGRSCNFSAFMFHYTNKLVQESQTLSHPVGSFILLGLLANYNKFEIQNPYQLRLDDFVNELTIQKLIRSVGYTCASLREDYVAVQHDLPEGWSISNTLSMIGLGVLAPVKQATPAYDPEITREMFAKLPGSEAAILLATYDFVYANKLFCLNFVSLGAENGQENPISSFLSLASYLLQHAHTSIRTAQYSHLSLLIISLLVEDKALCERLCGEDTKTAVRLCRQRSPYLPHVPGERIIATSILDTMIDGINHNLRRRLDVDLYILCLGVISRIISQLSRSRSRLKYHWSELFRSLLSLVRFLTTYTADLKSSNFIEKLLDDLVNLLALSLSAGESFLPNPASYDDLFYKIVEIGEVLVKFRDNYGLEKRPTNSIDTLINVSTHYNQLLQDGASGRRGSQLTSAQVAGVIKQGYETLSIQAKEGLDSWTKYREAEKKAFMKKVARCVVTDIKIYIRLELIK
ncbi:hypothetical protein BGHDH14_bgh03250 [Blumeria hordei DH14]|uniref:Armadillo-like helical domain-containing protein n=1 Tax=Blumeria graminis f. sp. hordei (strain DH14) TaxID=546991 RepID=N1JEJ7_BLUG1|nr:hypothetical protein BGHDH14_bgh03250 [Blumeria hordei DH14]